jgi:hypothetical protein
MFALLISVLLATLVICSAYLTSDIRSRSRAAGTSNSNNQQANNPEDTKPEAKQPETAKTSEKSKETGTGGNTDSADTGNSPIENDASPAPDQTADSHIETSQGQNSTSDTCPPDGRIFSGPEPPYAYIPTCTPKEITKIPVIPPSPED